MTIRIESLDLMKAAIKKCVECGRVFNLFKDEDAQEFYNGHDCEVGDANLPAL